MIKYFKFSAALLALGFTSFSAIAQSDDAPPPAQKDENIVIRKKGSSDQKLTVVVDGDKVTINGKPLAEYKSENGNVEIITNDNDMQPMIELNDMPPVPPMPGGGVKMMRTIHMNKAFLGVMSEKTDNDAVITTDNGAMITPDDGAKITTDNGAKITDVTKGSPAEKAGLQVGDIITKAGDATIANSDDLYKAIGKYNPGDKVNITYSRNGKTTTLPVTLEKNASEDFTMNRNFNYKMFAPKMRNFSYSWNDDKPRMGIEVQDTEDGNGVKITDLNDDDVPAAKAGLKEGDIITSINGKNIKSTDDLKDILKDTKQGDTVAVQYLRDGKSQSAQVKFPKDLKSADL